VIYINGSKLYKGSWCINNVFYFSLPLVTCGLGFFFISFSICLFSRHNLAGLFLLAFLLWIWELELLGYWGYSFVFLILILRNSLFFSFSSALRKVWVGWEPGQVLFGRGVADGALFD